MKNKFIDDGSAKEIDERITRVLKDLDYSSGPVNLAEVRDLLRLDLSYYTAKDPGLGMEIVHKLKIGANQVIKRPALLLEAIKKLELKALFLPDRKRILIDADLPDLKKRWSETHEIAHSIIPWHKEYMLGDTRETLSPTCHETIEAEANYGAGRLLFPSRLFIQMAASVQTLSDIKAISEEFGNTITSTLWRHVENSPEIMFGAIGEHPRYPRPSEPVIAYFIRSPLFEKQFNKCTEQLIFEEIKKYCRYQKRGPLGQGDVILDDDNGQTHIFSAETFCNRYHALTLARYKGPHRVVVAVQRPVPAPSL